LVIWVPGARAVSQWPICGVTLSDTLVQCSVVRRRAQGQQHSSPSQLELLHDKRLWYFSVGWRAEDHSLRHRNQSKPGHDRRLWCSGAGRRAQGQRGPVAPPGEPDGAFDLDRAERTHHDNTSSGTRAHGCVDACRDDPHEASNVDEMTRQRALVGWTLASSHGWL